MKEFVFILPNSAWGVASVVSNIIRHSVHPHIHKKVILVDLLSTKKACEVDFGDAEVILISTSNPWIESKRALVRKIARHITLESVIISNDGNPEFSMIEQLRMTNPVVAVLHGDYSHYFRGCCRYGYLIDRVVCVSSYLEKKAAQILPHHTKPVFIPYPTPEVEIGSKDFSYELTISYVGVLNEAKGCDLFPIMVDLLDKKKIAFTFNIYGDGPLYPRLKETLANNRNVVFHGKKSNREVISALKNSHISIHLSKNEGLPVSLVEAMKSGSVPVVFDLPTGIPDLIDDGINGFRLQQGDVEGAVEKISLLSANRVILKEMSESAMIKATDMFNPTQQSRRYEDTFFNTTWHREKFDVTHYSFSTKILNRLPIKLAYFIRKNIN